MRHGRRVTEEDFRRAFASGQVKILRPALPCWVRIRLLLARRVNLICCWLVERGYYRAAEGVWRACRLWH